MLEGGPVCGGGHRFRGNRRSGLVKTLSCPVVVRGVRLGRVWLGKGEARFRLALGGGEGLVVGVAATGLAAVVLFVVQLVM